MSDAAVRDVAESEGLRGDVSANYGHDRHLGTEVIMRLGAIDGIDEEKI